MNWTIASNCLPTIVGMLWKSLFPAFQRRPKPKDTKYQIINEMLELKLAFFFVFFRLLRPQAKFGWVCETIRFRRDPLAICMDTNRLASQRERGLNIINYRIVGLVESSFIHMCDDDDVHLLICSINLALTMMMSIHTYIHTRPRAVYLSVVICLTRSQSAPPLRLLVQQNRFLTRWPRPTPRIDKLHFLN